MNPTQPPLSELLARYLGRQASAHEEGLGFAEVGDEVVPHDAVPVQPVEPRLAWNEALAALRHLGGDARSLKAPPDWPTLVASHETEVALPFCLGNFPQMVRHLPALLQDPDGALRAAPGRPLPAPGVFDWAEQAAAKGQYPQALLAAAALRLARQFDAAADLLGRLRGDAPDAWQAALANEEAALAWHRGRLEDAAALWDSQPESVPVLFNRGLAALFLGRPAAARAALARAAAGLPEDDGWHHLARLYLALAETRG
jgi:tetratricopeptide (TPR) repeat protein